ncbi:MAG: hypothetical protein R2856_00170 [Caldilineaceae bacterium]
MTLSDRQKHILNSSSSFDEKNFPPSIREIGQAVGITSTSVVKYNLNKLERDELIVRKRGEPWPELELGEDLPIWFGIAVWEGEDGRNAMATAHC